MELIFFYISQYWLYGLCFVGAIILSFLLLKSNLIADLHHRILACVLIVLLAYLFLFSGYFGGALKPYLNDLSGFDNRRSFRYGTGVFINPDTVLTNQHVASGCQSITVKDQNNSYISKVIAAKKSKGIDLAFIKTNAFKKNFAILSNQYLKIGDIVFYPDYTSKVAVFSKARAKLVQDLGDELKFLDPTGRKGNSGSPVYNNRGYLVGLIWGGGGITSSYMVASKIEDIKNLADQNNVKLYTTENQNFDLTKGRKAFDEVVTILCF
ncbi:MAG: serine protease [Rickettsiales bacterium]|nr:serine protease [Rickettsiales bacterium]